MSATEFRLDNVRVAFPNLFKATQFNGTGNFRCGATLIITPDHPQLPQVKAAIEAAALAKWGEKAAARLKAARAKNKIALTDGDLKSKYDGFEGNQVLSANCRGGATEAEATKPTVYGKNPKLGPITEEAKSPIYSGCYVNAKISLYADDRFGDGVFCSLTGIQFAADGDAFGAAPARADDFDDIADSGGEDPAAWA